MIKRLLALSPLVLLTSPVAAHARQEPYAEGQVWQYATRAQDAGSLVKIQKIENANGHLVYHISLVGVHFAGLDEASVLEHLPVSEEALDASVTRRVPAARAFSDISVAEDIAEWHEARGGVLTVPLAQALDNVDAMLASQL